LSRYERVRRKIEDYPLLRGALNPLFDATAAVLFHLRKDQEYKQQWRLRTRDVIECPDNAHIPRVPHAGRIAGGYQTMHNGIKVLTGGYYGYPQTRLLKVNRGVHEPQEERVFGEVLKYMSPGSVIVELGAYWAFYSMWFHQVVKDARCYLVEPDAERIESGIANFKANGFKGDFTAAFVGRASGTDASGVRVIGVDDFVTEKKIDRVGILHADIQGAELEMLEGAVGLFTSGRVDYVFISTHSNELHAGCTSWLQDHGFTVIASANQDETYSYDGLIVARRTNLPGLERVSIALKPNAAVS